MENKYGRTLAEKTLAYEDWSDTMFIVIANLIKYFLFNWKQLNEADIETKRAVLIRRLASFQLINTSFINPAFLFNVLLIHTVSI